MNEVNSFDNLNSVPDENMMVYHLRFNHDHYCENSPLVIFKTTQKIHNHDNNKSKWYGLIRNITYNIYQEEMNTELMSNWVFMFNHNERPNGQDDCYMKEFLFDHYIHVLCFMHNDPLINIHLKLFVDNCITRCHLLKYDKDFNCWDSCIFQEDIEHEQG